MTGLRKDTGDVDGGNNLIVDINAKKKKELLLLLFTQMERKNARSVAQFLLPLFYHNFGCP